LEKILPMICEDADDKREYGSTANCDLNALQAISKRIHYGKFVAEAKFQAQPEEYGKLIRVYIYLYTFLFPFLSIYFSVFVLPFSAFRSCFLFAFRFSFFRPL